MTDDQVALVTGASRGLGQALCVELVRGGFTVFGTGRDEEALAGTAERCQPHGTFRPLRLDVRSAEDVDRTVGALPRLDLCLNNAGVLHVESLLEMELDQIRETVDVNVLGAFLVARAAARRMVREGGGRIVDIASDGAVKPLPRAPVYAGSKHALAGLSKSLAAGLEDEGVQVTTVYPGGIDTEMHAPSVDRGGLMAADEVARVIVRAVLESGSTVRVSELHLQPLNGRPTAPRRR
jgi:NAD(P)-dependent dehydrogenase (short-subunit alcohol dehydrogenase family)